MSNIAIITHLLGLLDLADEVSARIVAARLGRGAHDDTITVRRDRDVVIVKTGHVETELASTSTIRVLEKQSPHLAHVQTVGAAASTRYERLQTRLVAVP